MKYVCSVLIINCFVFAISYEVPEPKITVYEKGFRVSVPDADGIELFAFHGNINIDMYGLEAGQFSKDITKKQGVEWVFEDFKTKLQPGDVIYYWLYVQKHGFGYRYDNGEFIVKDKTSRPYTVPEPKIEVYCNGFKVSIPHEKGIELFAFHGKINENMNDLEAGHYSKDILEKHENAWAFEEKETQIKKGDVINYWLFVIKDNLGYRYDNGTFVVKAHTNNDIDVRMSDDDKSLNKNANNQLKDNEELDRSTTTESLEKLKQLNKIWIR